MDQVTYDFLWFIPYEWRDDPEISWNLSYFGMERLRQVLVMCTAPVAASWGTKMSECDRGAFQTISIQGPVHSCWISASNGIWVGVQLWRRGAVTPQAPIPPGYDKVQLRVWRLKLDPWHRGFVSEKWGWGCPERQDGGGDDDIHPCSRVLLKISRGRWSVTQEYRSYVSMLVRICWLRQPT